MAQNHTVRTTRRRLHAVGAGTEVAAGTLDEHLSSLAALIEARTFAGDDDPQIIRITRDGVTEEGIDVGLRLIDEIDDSVVSALTGFNAPDDWLAVGVSTGGNAYPLEGGRDAPRRVRLVHLVSRDGASASVARLAGEEPRVVVGESEAGPMVGRVDDVCRRALGLPTAPAGSTLEFWALVWLERLVALGTDRAPTTWEAVAAEHLAVGAFAEANPARTTEVSNGIVRFARILSAIESWPALREACGAGRLPFDGVPAAVARWLDDGAFSRWVLGTYPPLDQLAAAADDLLSPALARRLRAVLREWDLDVGAHHSAKQRSSPTRRVGGERRNGSDQGGSGNEAPGP